jgi:hypothetical protein
LNPTRGGDISRSPRTKAAYRQIRPHSKTRNQLSVKTRRLFDARALLPATREPHDI